MLHRLSLTSLAGLALGAALAFVPRSVDADDIPTKVPDHPLLAKDGETLKASGPLRFAIVGNTRSAVPASDLKDGKVVQKGVLQSVVDDIAQSAQQEGGPAVLVLMGDQVRKGAPAEYKVVDKRLGAILDGAKEPKGGAGRRLRAMPVAGDHEGLGDDRYFAFGDAFAGVGADIGFGRVASWYAYDLLAGDHTWRFMVLDADKEGLGSRWTEQLNWITRSTKDEGFDSLVVFMHQPLFDLGTRGNAMNQGGGPQELIDHLEDAIGVQRLKLIVSAGTHTNAVLMPDGPRGTLHVSAGASGDVVDHLKRWAPADEAGRAEDLNLEPIFDLAMLDQLDRWNRDVGLPEVAIDEAKARNAFDGFTAAYNARHVPVTGWWEMRVEGSLMVLDFHYRKLDGTFVNAYRTQLRPETGWMPSRPAK